MLKKLRSIDFSDNHLTSLEGVTGTTCSMLRHVYVNYNNITVLKSGSLDCFTNLQTLNISNSGLKLVENGTFSPSLKSLLNIYGPYNELISIDSSIVSMLQQSKPMIINFAHNNITTITNSANITADFFDSKRFHLNLLYNNITGIDVTYFEQLFNITNTTIGYFHNCSFDVRFNPFICDCSILEPAHILKYYLYPNDTVNPVFNVKCASPPALNGMDIIVVKDTDFNCSVVDQCPRGCSCIKTISLQLLTISCRNSAFGEHLPDEIPTNETFHKTHIHIQNTPLKVLEWRKYLRTVSILDLAHNDIETIDERVIQAFPNLDAIFLNDNSLKHLPKWFQNITFRNSNRDGNNSSNLTSLRIDGNLFKCDCHALWMKTWLLDHKEHIPYQDRILCNTGIPVIETKDGDFLCTRISIEIILSIAFGASLLLVFIGQLVRLNWTHIQVLMIARFNIHCCRKKVRTNLKYDIFLSHSSHDEDVVFQEIIPRLENHYPPFRICRADRDFTVGRTIAYNIISNIESSLTTLLVISNNFLQSEWCKMEFKQAHMKLLQDKTSNLIMIILEDLDSELMDKEMTYYVKTHVYLNITDQYFWAKLFQALPIRQPAILNDGTDSQANQLERERAPLLIN